MNSHRLHGIGKTTHRLYVELARCENALGPASLRCYVPAQAAERFPPDVNLPVRPLAPGEDLIAAATADGAQVVHIQDYFFPLYNPKHVRAPQDRPYRLVVTVRDLIPFVLPIQKRRGLERIRMHLVPLLPVADLIVAISEATKWDLERLLHVTPNKMVVIHHGVDHEVFHTRHLEEDVTSLLDRYQLRGPYILYVSSFNQRKNHRLLVHAFHWMRRVHRVDCDLVLVGPGRPDRQMVAEIRNLKLERRVRILGEVSQHDLALLYRGAALFAFPSVYEGFGNPVLEAMASGVPVVALRRSSVPEITGQAALLVDSEDTTAFADAMRRVLVDSSLAQQMREEGLRRAAEFTWRRAAEATLAAYGRVLGST